VTDGGLNAIVRVDAKTKEVKLWPLPEARGYTNLNTAAFDPKVRFGSPARTVLWAPRSKDRRNDSNTRQPDGFFGLPRLVTGPI
jgi:hypothetical protein